MLKLNYPLSFCVKCFNQKWYIGKTLDAAYLDGIIEVVS